LGNLDEEGTWIAPFADIYTHLSSMSYDMICKACRSHGGRKKHIVSYTTIPLTTHHGMVITSARGEDIVLMKSRHVSRVTMKERFSV
jgi:hypothetical protein